MCVGGESPVLGNSVKLGASCRATSFMGHHLGPRVKESQSERTGRPNLRTRANAPALAGLERTGQSRYVF